MSKNVDHKGRRSEPRHVRLYHSVTGCDAWADLSGNAVKLLVAIARLDNGGSNGELFLSARDAATAIRVSINTAWRAFSELESHGFIAATERGRFKPGQHPATKWRLTWLSAPGHRPTRDFDRWTPDGNKSPSQKLTRSVANIETIAETDRGSFAKIATDATETSGVSNSRIVSNTATQVVSHGLGAGEPDSDRWKLSNSAGGVSADLTGHEPIDQLRDRLIAYLDAAPVGAQTRLADAARIPAGTLSKFRGGRGLSDHHFVNLQLALAKASRKEAA